MLLDKLLAKLDVQVAPFAMCLLSTGWRLSLPGPPEVLLHFVLKGSGVVRGPRGEPHILETSWLAIVPRGAPHVLECGTTVRSVVEIEAPPPLGGGAVRLTAGPAEPSDLEVACGVVIVSYGDSLRLFQRLEDVLVVDLSGLPQVRSAFEGILAEQAGLSTGSATLTQALMTQCLVYLLRRLAEDPQQPLAWLAALDDPNLIPAVDLVLEHPERAHTVASLADAAAMSRSTFAERFHMAFGCTPMHFLHDVRLRRAAHLLRRGSNLTLDQVAKSVGFTSRSHFSQAFKDHFGLAPKDFRRQ